MFINRIGGSAGRTINFQVNASGDDGYWDSDNGIVTNGTLYIGRGGGILWHSFFRWTGITIPAGKTIKLATVSINANMKVGTLNGNLLYFNDSKTPTAPTTATQANAKVLTTANVACNPTVTDTWINYDVLLIINELLSSYGGYSNNAMMGIIIGAGYSDMNYAGLYSYDTDPTLAPKLTISW